jgi:hypothetical protein
MKFVYVILAIGYVSDYFNLITADLIKFWYKKGLWKRIIWEDDTNK